MRRICSVVFSCFLLFACSSVPDQPKETVEKKNRAAEYTKAGNSYFNQGQYTQALQFFNLALNDNISVDNEAGIIQSYNSIGKVYMAAGYLDEAEQNFRSAAILAQILQDAQVVHRLDLILHQVPRQIPFVVAKGVR